MLSKNNSLVLLRGGGDLASGVALRLHRAGISVAITELPEPLAVRRTVSFSEAVYEGHHSVEGVHARLVNPDQLSAAVEAGDNLAAFASEGRMETGNGEAAVDIVGPAA